MNPPELQTIARALRRAGRPDVAEQLIDAERSGATGSEILGRIGLVLREHARLRGALDDEARRAWDALAREIDHAIPGTRLRLWLARLLPLAARTQPRSQAAPPDEPSPPLAGWFSDAQTRAAYLAIRRGLADGSLNLASAKDLAVAIRPPLFDSGFGDGEKQVQDYEKRQLHAALDQLEVAEPAARGRQAAERFDACLAKQDLR